MYLNQLCIGHLNTCSILSKINEIWDILLSNKYHIIGFTESWLNTDVTDDMIAVTDYNCFRSDRATRGGGICIFVKKYLSCKFIDIISNDLFEQLWLSINCNKSKLAVGIIYRPPKKSKKEFIDKFEDVISSISLEYSNIACLGDFNINLLESNAPTREFLSVLDSLSLTQIINEPTRVTLKSSSLIDFVILSNSLDIISSEVIDTNLITDHFLVNCCFYLPAIVKTSTTKVFRNFSQFDLVRFESDLRVIPWNKLRDIKTIDDKVAFLNSNLITLFDKHAPFRTTRVKKKPTPWITDNIKFMIRLRNKALSKFKVTGNSAHWNFYKNLRNYVTFAIRAEKRVFMEIKLQNANNKQKWNILKDLNIVTFKKADLQFSNLNCTADKINSNFLNTNGSIVNPDVDTINFYVNNHITNFENLFSFSTVNENEISNIILSIKSKATGLDNINISMIQLTCPFLTPFITYLVNFCLQNSVFPSIWKEGKVLPIPKNKNPVNLDDLRPITILSTLSKILERAVETQLRIHLNKHDILPPVQSGFRPGFSCSSALLNITDDLFRELDNKKCAVLILLDYTKAFDTINHRTLLSILHYIGLSAPAITFFECYLRNRSQRVFFGGELSAVGQINQGVAQGSILGPLLFTIYTCNFPSVLNFLKIHMYADDTQLYYAYNKETSAIEEGKVNDDLSRLVEVSNKHNLKLNPSKSSAIFFGNSTPLSITLNGDLINPVNKSRNLGIVFDNKLRFSEHITHILSRSFVKLRVLYSSRHIISSALKTTLCESLILSLTNYCDYLYGPCLSVKDAARLQKLQNSCLRLIFGIRKFERISHTLAQVGWLNMCNRRKLHMLAFYHKIIKTGMPPYLYNRIRYRTDVHNLNLRNKNLICLPRFRTCQYTRSFSYNVAKYYNALGQDYKSMSMFIFKKRLKRDLFLKQCNTKSLI